MSILIKGIDIPKDDFIDVRIFSGGVAIRVTKEEPCIREYETVEVTEPHGRLIDGDDLITAFPANEAGVDVKIASVRGTILHVPTVIEAEGEK